MDVLSGFLLQQRIQCLGSGLLLSLHIKSLLRSLFSFLCNFALLPSPSPADASWPLQSFLSSLVLSLSSAQPQGLKTSHQKGTVMCFSHSDPRDCRRPVSVEDIANSRRLWNVRLALLLSHLWTDIKQGSDLSFAFLLGFGYFFVRYEPSFRECNNYF